MDGSSRSERLRRVQREIGAHGADWLLVPASADFFWLTAAHARATERLLALGVPAQGDPFGLVPRLEAEALGRECPWLELEIWDEHEDPFDRLETRLNLKAGPSVLLGEGWRTAVLLRLAARARCRSAAAVIAPLRAVKDPDEIALLERAASHADEIVEQIADWVRPGMSERSVAREILERFEALGDTLPWAIVASGPNAALPHHMSSDRKIGDGEVLLLDLGAYTGGYGSDITRTYWLGPVPDEGAKVYDLVNRARAAGVAAAKAGAIPEAVDRAARSVIEAGGYGERFIHRLGHGVGLEIHEPPYIVAGNREPLAAGNIHSVEPGIYLGGRFGVRIEDLVVVEATGARLLNRAPRDPRPPRMR